MPTRRNVPGAPPGVWPGGLATLLAAGLLALSPGTAAAAPAPSPTASPSAAPSPAPITVTVNAHGGLGDIHELAYGTNAAVWDSHMNDQEVADLYRAGGIGAVRYPGGSYGDIYHWETHTAPGGYVAPGTGFDQFIGTVKAAGAQAVVIANYGTGTPEEAAGWVRYANVTKKYGVKYWEVGNELYGNGYYGANWEADDHADKSPRGYATNTLEFVRAMKAEDPTIKVGAVLTLSGNWPDGVVAEGDAANWNHTVIPLVADEVDFFSVHWYPWGDIPQMLNGPAMLADMLAQLRADITAMAGRDVPLALTEVNSNVGRNTQPGALFAADAYLTAAANGVFTVDWWNTRNGMGEISTVEGATDYNDYGFLSSGACTGETCQPPVNTPFPAYHGIKILSTAGKPGDTLVKAATSDPKVAAHAVRQADGDLAVVLINKDPANSHPVALRYTGYSPAAGAPVTYTFAKNATSITTASQGTATAQTLPPYSITTMTLKPAKNSLGSLPAPGQPSVSGATVSWPAVAGQVDKYEVYRQAGGNAELLGTTRGTSLALSNLVPGTTYTVNVLARDQAGRLSKPSNPVTFVAPTPANSTCAVKYRVTQGWGNGFLGSVTITNRKTTDVVNWTLNFRFPVASEWLSSGWNGTWTADGRDVKVTPADFNTTIPAGGSVEIGFVGGNNGAYPSPTAFTLNGTVCQSV